MLSGTKVALRARHGTGKILVDSRERTGRPSMSDIVAGSKLLAARLGQTARVAVLVRELDDGQLYFRVAAAGLGTAVAYFVDPARAEAWLAGDD